MKRLKKYIKKQLISKPSSNTKQDDRVEEIGKLSTNETKKRPLRTDIINYFITYINASSYLEIGVRNPDDNFNKINCKAKFSVDPGLEFKQNPVDFKLTSDQFFEKLKGNKLHISKDHKFDVIFIDGLHLADQVERDIANSLTVLSKNGVLILHDCNPPSSYHAREDFEDKLTPARDYWNGTTWKAFYKYRHDAKVYSLTFDTDWGVGILSKKQYPLFNNLSLPVENPYFEYKVMDKKRTYFLNLIDYNFWLNQVK